LQRCNKDKRDDPRPLFASGPVLKEANVAGIMAAMTYRVIDLFAGAGGLTEGFREAFGSRLEPVWANDFNRSAVDTYNYNFGSHCIYGDILDLLDDDTVHVPEADVVMGGPPCQGFSLLNKNRDGDLRKEMWRPYMEVVRRSGASVFVMENVPQLLGTPEHQDIICAAEALGFPRQNITWAKLCAADYGVPQVRNRAFIVGCSSVLMFPRVFPARLPWGHPQPGLTTGPLTPRRRRAPLC